MSAEEGAKFKVVLTLKTGKTMWNQDVAKEFGIVSSQGRILQAASSPFLLSGGWKGKVVMPPISFSSGC